MTALLGELDRLRYAVAALFPPGAASGDALRLVARLVPGLNNEQCERLLDATFGQGWFALSLAPADYPNLHALRDILDNPDDTCLPVQAMRPRSFIRKLREEAERAGRHHADLALIILSGAGPLDEQSLLVLAEAAQLQMGGGDTLIRLDADHLAVIVPSARQLKARALAERILDHFAAALPLSSALPPCPAARAGIACFSPDANLTDAAAIAAALHEQALAALETAPANQARVHQRDTRPMSERSVLVQAGEKQFLFFGSMEQS